MSIHIQRVLARRYADGKALHDHHWLEAVEEDAVYATGDNVPSWNLVDEV